jgi:hypothetical protein
MGDGNKMCRFKKKKDPKIEFPESPWRFEVQEEFTVTITTADGSIHIAHIDPQNPTTEVLFDPPIFFQNMHPLPQRQKDES